MGLAGIYSEMDVNQEQVLMKTVRKGGETDIPVGGQESLREISLWLKSEHAAFIVAQSTWEKKSKLEAEAPDGSIKPNLPLPLL